MKMQAVPQQDRPKLIAVVIGFGVAVTFVVRSLAGTPIQAQSGAPPTAAVPAAPLAAASADLASGGTLPATEAAEQSSAAVSFGEPEGLPLTDPFHPVKGDSAPSSAPAAPAVVTPPAAPRRIASTPVLPGKSLPERAVSLPAVSLPKPPQPAIVAAASPVAAPSSPTVLCGTVCQGRSGVAILRGEGKSVFARVGETVSGWQITSIRLGQMGVSRATIHRRVRVGEALPVDNPAAVDPKAPGA